MRTHTLAALLAMAVLCAHQRPANSHSFMLEPPPYNEVYYTKSCSGSECVQACPNYRSSGMKNTPSNPAATWRRGQKVSVEWAKNNHRGGMVRMSLVPADVMMSRPWHTKLALWHGCWESGEFTCSNCGSDTNREAYRRSGIEIPAVFPDGIYVVGILWYGGLHFSRDRGMFPDYYSCSFVRIQGGAPLGGSYQPFWEAGDAGQFNNNGLCQTASDLPGQCPQKSECFRKSYWAVAKEYQNGGKPARITPKIVAEGFKDKPDLSGVSNDDDDRGGSLPPNTQAPPVSATTTTETVTSESATTEASTSTEATTTKGSGGGGRGPKLCSGRVCCPKKCGKCGGSGCNSRPGGGENCCFSRILRSNRMCADYPPPCILRR